MAGRTIKTNLTEQLGLHIPLIQAPMAGGATTPELVAAVSNAGALGSLGGAYLPPAELEKNIRQIKRLTARPFVVNLFSPSSDPVLSPKQIEAAIEATNIYREELGLAEPHLEPPFSPNFRDQFDVILAERPAVFSFTFGIPDQKFLAECRKPQNSYFRHSNNAGRGPGARKSRCIRNCRAGCGSGSAARQLLT